MGRVLHVVGIAALVANLVVTRRAEGRLESEQTSLGRSETVDWTYRWTEPSSSAWGCGPGVQPKNLNRCERILKKIFGLDSVIYNSTHIAQGDSAGQNYLPGCSYHLEDPVIYVVFNEYTSPWTKGNETHFLVCSVNLKLAARQMRYKIQVQRKKRNSDFSICQSRSLTIAAFKNSMDIGKKKTPLESVEERVKGEGYQYDSVAENSVWKIKTLNKAFKKWNKGGEDKANIMNTTLPDVGYAVYPRKPGSDTYVHTLYFGKPTGDTPPDDSICVEA